MHIEELTTVAPGASVSDALSVGRPTKNDSFP